MIGSRIAGLGSFVPPRVVTNHDLAQVMDTSDEWIQQRTGIKQRHWVEGKTTTSDLALEASQRALQEAGITAKDLDMIILATLSPDHQFPGTACFLQAKLGAPGIAALDIRQQCTGFVYGMSIADQFIRTGTYQKILVVGAEVHSKGLDKSTKGRDVSVLFGDGAGAVVMMPAAANAGPAVGGKGSKIFSTHLHADGEYARELWVDLPTMADSTDYVTHGMIDEGRQWTQMNGKSVFMHAAKRMPEVIEECLRANQVKLEEVDLFVLHQANLRIIEMAAKQLGIPAKKVFNTIDRFGNTTAATIPLGLDEARKAGVLKPGMLVCSAAFGSGFTWASALYRW
jgi:3-oxoacyl-[acyl-carrier-protein] synthase-3